MNKCLLSPEKVNKRLYFKGSFSSAFEPFLGQVFSSYVFVYSCTDSWCQKFGRKSFQHTQWNQLVFVGFIRKMIRENSFSVMVNFSSRFSNLRKLGDLLIQECYFRSGTLRSLAQGSSNSRHYLCLTQLSSPSFHSSSLYCSCRVSVFNWL